MPADKPGEDEHVFDDRGLFSADTEAAPSVITGGPAEQGPSLGDVAYVPTLTELSPGDEEAMLMLTTTSSGERAVLAYSTLDRLVHCCGDHQPWIAFRTERIDALPEVAGADVLLWNEELPADQRRNSDPG